MWGGDGDVGREWEMWGENGRGEEGMGEVRREWERRGGDGRGEEEREMWGEAGEIKERRCDRLNSTDLNYIDISYVQI